jgi:hypothetical protein
MEMTVIVFLKNVWSDVEGTRGNQLETESASERFKQRVLDIRCLTRKKFWLFFYMVNSKSIWWTTVIEILVTFSL